MPKVVGSVGRTVKTNLKPATRPGASGKPPQNPQPVPFGNPGLRN
jgi:hypothetical protein